MSAAVHPSQLPETKSFRVRADEVVRRCKLPNGAERIEIYGLDGLLHRREEPDGSQIAFRYDVEGEVREIEHSSGERVSYEGTSKRNILRSETERCETTIEFDAGGFPSRLIQRVDEFEWTIEYRRDEIGRVTACRYPQAHNWLEASATSEGKTDFYAGPQFYLRLGATQGEQTTEFCDGTRTITSLSGTQSESLTCRDAKGEDRVSMNFEVVEGRLAKAGQHAFEYDEKGRLARCAYPGANLHYKYDDAGRLATVQFNDQINELGYAEHPAAVSINNEALIYDLLGRRTARGDTKYSYNFFGQLTGVTLANGVSVHYLYDGFGRLVARECEGECVYYIVDFEGHRFAEADAGGRVRRSYLWHGLDCIAEIEGVLGEPLSRSFHRGFAGRLLGIGSSGGEITLVRAGDPYGIDQIRSDGAPSFGSLFSDPVSGLYHAASRWFDPETAQFLTPDGWFGTDAWNHLPPEMRSVFDGLPGGTNIVESSETAYAWCHYDPINFSDPNGHSAVGTGFGLAFSVISFFLWQMHATSLSLRLAAVNFIVMIIPSLIDLIVSKAGKDEPLSKVNIFNSIPHPLASSRLMVPWAIPLNAFFVGERAFTLGSVIWIRRSSVELLEEAAQRDLLVCANANTYLSANSVASDVFAVPRFATPPPTINGDGTMDPTAQLVTGANIDPSLAPGTLPSIFLPGDAIGIRKRSDGKTEFVKVAGTNVVAAPDIQLDITLPADFQNQPVEFFRLDPGFVKITKDPGTTVARTITFIRNTSIHYGAQLPDVFPTSNLTAEEYLYMPERKRTFFTGNNDFPLIEFSDAAINDYNMNDFLRILSGSSYFGRKLERKRGKNAILDVALPTPLDPNVEVAVMAATAAPVLNNQASTGDLITVGTDRTLRKHDGLTVAVGAGVVEDRRIVLQTFLRCLITSLPAGLQGIPLKVDVLNVSAKTGNGSVTAADTVTVGRDEAKQFSPQKPVRIASATGVEFLTTILKVTASSETIQLSENLPPADFPNATVITIVLLTPVKTLDAEPTAAPGGSVDVKSDDLIQPVNTDLLLIRPATGAASPVTRRVNGDPVVVARVDSSPTNNANLTVQIFSADAARTNKGVAKKVVLRLTPSAGGVHPYALNDEIYCASGTEEYIGKNIAPAGTAALILEDPIITPGFNSGSFRVELVAKTNRTTTPPDAHLEASLIAIPSDPDEDPVSRRRAVELHEMRHVWQYAVLGPFFLSQPLPLLFKLGFSKVAKEHHYWLRFASVAGLEKLVSLVAWGGSELLGLFSDRVRVGETAITGTVSNAERTRITFDAQVSSDDVSDFPQGATIEVHAGDNTLTTFIERARPDDRSIDLALKLDEEFAQGTAVRISISPFEKIDSKFEGIFNLTKVWEKILPNSWSHILNKFMSSENWFPFLGLYFMAEFRAGFSQDRIYLEQDAAFQSGDLYTPFGVAYPNEIFVGEFSRVLAFLFTRFSNEPASGLSDRGRNITRAVTIRPQPSVANPRIFGTASAGGTLVRFRKEFMIPMNEKVENAIGGMFIAGAPGNYDILAFDGSTDFSLDNMVDPAIWLPPFIPFFPTDFNELRTIKVKPLTVDKNFTTASPLFETETVAFTITGAKQVSYSIRYRDTPPALPGVIDPVNPTTFTAPTGVAAPNVTHELEIVSTYDANHDIFKARGKLHEQIVLPAANLINGCQNLDIVIAPITVDAVGPVRVGTTTEFHASISPARIDRISADIPEALVQADLQTLGERPARLSFRAPSNVNAAQDVRFRLTFGTTVQRQIEIAIRVEP